MYLKLLTTIILFFLSFQSAFSNETILPIKKPDLNEKNTTKKIADIIPLPKPSEKEDEIQKEIKITTTEIFKKIDGVSLKPIIEGGSMVEKIAFSETGNPLDSNTPPKKPNTKSVRTSKWKLIYNEYNDSKELYDLENDPDENENLIGTGLEIEKVLWTELVRIQNGD